MKRLAESLLTACKDVGFVFTAYWRKHSDLATLTRLSLIHYLQTELSLYSEPRYTHPSPVCVLFIFLYLQRCISVHIYWCLFITVSCPNQITFWTCSKDWTKSSELSEDLSALRWVICMGWSFHHTKVCLLISGIINCHSQVSLQIVQLCLFECCCICILISSVWRSLHCSCDGVSVHLFYRPGFMGGIKGSCLF